jgi:hypothetical protein
MISCRITIASILMLLILVACTQNGKEAPASMKVGT